MERGSGEKKWSREGKERGRITVNIHCTIYVCINSLTYKCLSLHNATVYINRIYYICTGDIGLLWDICETT